MGDRIAVMNEGRLEQVGTPAELYDAARQHVRGGLHRLAGDELRARRAARARARRTRSSACGRSSRGCGRTGMVGPFEGDGRVRRGAGARDVPRRRRAWSSRSTAARPRRSATRCATAWCAKGCGSSTPSPAQARLIGAVPSRAVLRVELAVATPAFLDMTFVGLEALPAPGEERFAGELVRSPGGGAITAVAAARLGLDTALVAPVGDDLGGEYVRREIERDGVAVAGFRTKRTPETVIMPVGEERTMVTVDPGIRARAGRRRGADAGRDRRQPRPARPRAQRRPRLPDLRRRRRARVRRQAAAAERRRAGALPQRAGRVRADRAPTPRRARREALAGWIETVVDHRRRAQRGGDRRRRAPSRCRTSIPARWSTPPATATCCAPPTRGPTCAARSRRSGSAGRSSTRSSRWACRPRSAAPSPRSACSRKGRSTGSPRPSRARG